MRKLVAFSALGILSVVLLARAGALSHLFSDSYLPHRFCYLAQPGLVWTNVVMDGLIAGSYALIFCSLFWVASRLRRIPALHVYLWIFISFGTFIVACAATHLMEIVTVWWPLYPLSAAVKVLCAAASVPTAILFARATPSLSANIRRFLDTLSSTQREKDQAVLALVASEKLAVVGRISASIAHEIRNPLESVGNLLYLLGQERSLPSDLKNLVASAVSELERANEVAHNTLSFYRQSATPVRLSLTALVQSVLELQTSHLVKRNISLQPRLRTPVLLTAYSGELRQILVNLIQNAAAAIQSDGRIIIRVQPRRLLAGNHPMRRNPGAEPFGERGYSITIADSGPGIEPENRARLFTLFFTTKGDQGTGLGLWLVRSMVEKQGGRLLFRSRTAAESRTPGTIFNIWIPFEPASIASERLSGSLSSAEGDGELLTPA